jgi:hypothetical protein
MVNPLGLPFDVSRMAFVTPSVHFIKSTRRIDCEGYENNQLFLYKGVASGYSTNDCLDKS